MRWMKSESKADAWLFLVGALAIATALFLPTSALTDPSNFVSELKALSPASVLAWLLAASGLWGFKMRFWRGDARERRRFTNCVLLILLQAVLLRTFLEEIAARQPFPWPWLPAEGWVWMPWFLVTGLAGILLGGRFGVLVCVASALMLYLLGDPGPWPLVGCLVSALTGILLLHRSPTRWRVLRACTGAGFALGLVAAAHQSFQHADIDAISAAVLLPL
ncbi:hypothetical protein EG831_12095, partial [bacterium]|nr:hypothetical protein [bacterium]